MGVEERGWSGHSATKGLQYKVGEQACRGPLPSSAPDHGSGQSRNILFASIEQMVQIRKITTSKNKRDVDAEGTGLIFRV